MKAQHRIGSVAVFLVLGALLSACLGPTQFDPTGRAPIGSLDLLVDSAGSVRAVGWAIDPETSAPIVVKVGSEGVVHDVVADGSRPDIAAAYPGMGAAHGFDYTFGPLSPGLHGVCVWIPNTVGGGDDRLLGCSNLTVSDPNPVGNLEVVTSLAPRKVSVGGWAFDPNTAGSTEVTINVDGQFGAKLPADAHRPDVGAAYGRSPAVGFATELTVTPGTHQICTAVWNVSYGDHRLLGCRNVTVAESTEDRRPTGKLTEVVPLGGGRVRVSGSASDPDGPVSKVRLGVDQGRPGAQALTVAVSGGTFSTVVEALADGLHTFCPVGVDVTGGSGLTGERAFLCGSAVLGDTSVGTGGTTSAPTPVGPSPGNPLDGAERDAGVSAVLSDGSVMWFFGDTLERDHAGGLLYFVNNTAAWAAAGSPTVTRDGSSGGQPVRFATPPSNWCSSEADHPTAAMWPESAVAIPQADGHTDRVVVFMSKVCLGDGPMEIVAKGMAIAETTYDRLAPPVDRPVTGVVTQANLAGVGAAWGRGAFLGTESTPYVYAYHCGTYPAQWGPCKVARAPSASLINPAHWRYWKGGDWSSPESWVAGPGSAAGMVVPETGGSNPPVASFTVTRDVTHGAYVMVYSPWPGFTDRVHVRVSQTPVGPWTAPVEVFLPGCNDSNGGMQYLCYAGTAQPKLDKAGLLGLGYYDQLVQVGPTRGQYMTVTVPFTVVVTAG